MYKVLSAKKFAGKVVSYDIVNLENGTIASVRINQLADFCILREFINAIYTKNGFEPMGNGFEVKENLLSEEVRKETLMNFLEQLCSAGLRVVAYLENVSIGCDPVEFLCECSGMTGKITAYPGTEYFNRDFPDILKCFGVTVAERTNIRPSDGCREKFWGWKGENLAERKKIGDTYFSISDRPYSRPRVFDGVNWWYDVFWVLTIYGDVRGKLYISKENKVLGSSLF